MKNNIKVTLVILLLFIGFLGFHFKSIDYESHRIDSAISPLEFELENKSIFKINGIDCFDANYTENNRKLASVFNITEDEAFIFGCLGKYWVKNQIEGRHIKLYKDDFIYNSFKYSIKLKNSPYSIINNQPTNKVAFNKQLNNIKHGKFVLIDLDTDIYYEVSKENFNKIKRPVLIRKVQVKDFALKNSIKSIDFEVPIITQYKTTFKDDNVKIIVSDSTSKLVPDRNCSADICKEILHQINLSKKSIDMAIYGYSSTPVLEQAFKNALLRGVKIRMVYDIDSKGKNIYPDTDKFTKIIPNSINDKSSDEVGNTMHNKFFVFDDNTVITGSANLSHTDMSGYNSNSIIVIDSPEIAKFYKNEFEQMYLGRFHNSKLSTKNKSADNIQVFFSPQDKAITNGILPIIKNAEKYIYISAFVITESRVTKELINAKNRGVDVKIIVDSLNASTKHSKHKELRYSGIPVKAENYAGKMHSKTIISDDKYLIIGSMNFSNSGENRNDENVIILNNKNASIFYKDFFLYQWNRIPDKWLKFTPRAEGPDSIGSCTDGLDNNYDGLTDSEDTACKNR